MLRLYNFFFLFFSLRGCISLYTWGIEPWMWTSPVSELDHSRYFVASTNLISLVTGWNYFLSEWDKRNNRLVGLYTLFFFCLRGCASLQTWGSNLRHRSRPIGRRTSWAKGLVWGPILILIVLTCTGSKTLKVELCP